MTADKFRIAAGPSRIQIECESCADSMDTANNDFGQVLAAEFAKQHRCE